MLMLFGIILQTAYACRLPTIKRACAIRGTFCARESTASICTRVFDIARNIIAGTVTQAACLIIYKDESQLCPTDSLCVCDSVPSRGSCQGQTTLCRQCHSRSRDPVALFFSHTFLRFCAISLEHTHTLSRQCARVS